MRLNGAKTALVTASTWLDDDDDDDDALASGTVSNVRGTCPRRWPPDPSLIVVDVEAVRRTVQRLRERPLVVAIFGLGLCRHGLPVSNKNSTAILFFQTNHNHWFHGDIFTEEF